MAQPIYNDTDFAAITLHVLDIAIQLQAGPTDPWVLHMDGGPYTGTGANIIAIRDDILSSVNAGTHPNWTAAGTGIASIRVTSTGQGQHIGGGDGFFNPTLVVPDGGEGLIVDVTPLEGIDIESLIIAIEADVLIETPLVVRPSKAVEWIDLESVPRTLQINFTVDPLPAGEKLALDDVVTSFVNTDNAALTVQFARSLETDPGKTKFAKNFALRTKGAPDFGIDLVNIGGAFAAGKRAITGLQARVNASDSSELDVSPGFCSDSTGESLGGLALLRNIDIDLSGAGGLDTGVKANSTWYAVYLIWIEDIVNEATDVAAMFSLAYEPTGPTMPGSFTRRRLIGSALTSASGALISFRIYGGGNELTYVWSQDRTLAPFRLVSGGSSQSFPDVDASGVVPITARGIRLSLDQTGGPSLFVRERDSVGGIDQPEGTVKIRSMASGSAWLGIDSERKFQYSNSGGGGNAFIDCTGFKVFR